MVSATKQLLCTATAFSWPWFPPMRINVLAPFFFCYLLLPTLTLAQDILQPEPVRLFVAVDVSKSMHPSDWDIAERFIGTIPHRLFSQGRVRVVAFAGRGRHADTSGSGIWAFATSSLDETLRDMQMIQHQISLAPIRVGCGQGREAPFEWNGGSADLCRSDFTPVFDSALEFFRSTSTVERRIIWIISDGCQDADGDNICDSDFALPDSLRLDLDPLTDTELVLIHRTGSMPPACWTSAAGLRVTSKFYNADTIVPLSNELVGRMIEADRSRFLITNTACTSWPDAERSMMIVRVELAASLRHYPIPLTPEQDVSFEYFLNRGRFDEPHSVLLQKGLDPSSWVANFSVSTTEGQQLSSLRARIMVHPKPVPGLDWQETSLPVALTCSSPSTAIRVILSAASLLDFCWPLINRQHVLPFSIVLRPENQEGQHARVRVVLSRKPNDALGLKWTCVQTSKRGPGDINIGDGEIEIQKQSTFSYSPDDDFSHPFWPTSYALPLEIVSVYDNKPIDLYYDGNRVHLEDWRLIRIPAASCVVGVALYSGFLFLGATMLWRKRTGNWQLSRWRTVALFWLCVTITLSFIWCLRLERGDTPFSVIGNHACFFIIVFLYLPLSMVSGGIMIWRTSQYQVVWRVGLGLFVILGCIFYLQYMYYLIYAYLVFVAIGSVLSEQLQESLSHSFPRTFRIFSLALSLFVGQPIQR